MQSWVWVANEYRSVWKVEILALGDVDSPVDRADREHLFRQIHADGYSADGRLALRLMAV